MTVWLFAQTGSCMGWIQHPLPVRGPSYTLVHFCCSTHWQSKDHFKMAMQAQNAWMQLYNQPEIHHYCTGCVQTYVGPTGKGILQCILQLCNQTILYSWSNGICGCSWQAPNKIIMQSGCFYLNCKQIIPSWSFPQSDVEAGITMGQSFVHVTHVTTLWHNVTHHRNCPPPLCTVSMYSTKVWMELKVLSYYQLQSVYELSTIEHVLYTVQLDVHRIYMFGIVWSCTGPVMIVAPWKLYGLLALLLGFPSVFCLPNSEKWLFHMSWFCKGCLKIGNWFAQARDLSDPYNIRFGTIHRVYLEWYQVWWRWVKWWFAVTYKFGDLYSYPFMVVWEVLCWFG